MVLLLIFLVIFFTGFILVDKFTFSLTLWEKFFSGTIVGIVLYLILSFILASFLKNPFWASMAINLFFLLFSILNHKNLLALKKLFSAFQKEKWLAFTLLFFLLIFSWQYPKVLLSPSAAGWHVGRNTFGDTQIHLGIINSFVFGKNYPPKNPFYAGEPLNYYFLSDFLSSIIVSYNYSPQTALLTPTLLFSLILVALLVLLIKRLEGKNISLFLGPLIFLFNGGLGFVYFLQDNKNADLIKALSHITKEYTHMWDKNIQFTNMVGGFLAPERPLILGIPLFLTILLLLISQLEKKLFNKNLFFASVLIALLPSFHLYFFLTIITCLFFYSLIDIYQRPEKFKKWFYAWFLIFLVSSLQIAPIILSISGRNFIKLHFGWLSKPKENLLFFWIKNLGIAPLLVSLALISRKLKKRVKFFFFPFGVLFILINLFSFQPYTWDNVKFLIAVHLASSILIALFLEKLATKNLLFKLLAPIIVILLILSGLISYLSEPQANYLLFANEDISLGEFIKKNTNTEDIFLTQPIHNSPPACLAGRSILMGYQGYLWTQGIDYKNREEDILKMLSANGLSEFKSLANAYNITYAVLNLKNNSIPINYQFFQKNFAAIYQSKDYQVFKLR